MKHFKVLHLLLFLESFRSGCLASSFTDQDICRTPEGRSGVCVKVQECSHMMQFIIDLEVVNTDVKEFLKLYTCGYDKNNGVKVCCPPTPIKAPATYKRKLLKEKIKLLPTDSCGVVPDTNRIIKGRNADLFEFPWMAVLMYSGGTNVGSASTQNRICGGTLISKRYVLTAAHCIDQKLVNVRLGDFNLTAEPDCDNTTKICAKPTQNFIITAADAIVHPNYVNGTLAHDVALIRLSADADTSTASVTPICLPLGKTFNRKKKYIVAGWGITETGWSSDILKKAPLIINNHDVCIKAYSRYKSYMHHENHLCTYGILKGESSCTGDSGGPLMLNVNDGGILRMTQYGVVSFGIKFCQYNPHHGFPSVFTNLLPYIDWILENIEP